MRIIRLFLYFVVGFLLSAVVVFAHAETITATGPTSYPRANIYGAQAGSVRGYGFTAVAETFANAADAAQAVYAKVPASYSDWTKISGPWSNSTCTQASFAAYVNVYVKTSSGCDNATAISFHYGCPDGGTLSGSSCVGVYTCPSGQNWTLSGSSCTRPDCVSPATRDPATGICVSPVCPTTSTPGYYSMGSSEDISGDYCENSCGYTLSLNLAGGEVFSSSSKRWLPMNKTGTGQSCAAPNPTPEGSPTLPNEPEKTPPCASGEGVIATSEGQVYCVPKALPGSDEPVVQKKVEKQTYPDGSEKTTTTTQTCTGAGACTTTTITNVTGAGGGTTPGEAGTPGTTEGKSTKPGNETAGFCAEHPGLQICGNGMNVETTQQKVLQELQRFDKPTATDDSVITNAKTFDAENADLVEKKQELEDAVKGTTDATSGSKSAWESAMSSGWISPIPMSGCSPFTSAIGSFSWTLDICPTAAKISEIGNYAMWFMLAIGTFVMFTGGRKEA